MTDVMDGAMTEAQLRERVRKMTPEQRRKLAQLSVPRIVDPYFVHIPHPKQQLFLSLMNREVMYGGAAGGGKSDSLLMSAAQFVDVPGYSALILRRTWPDLNAPGAILDRARSWWGGLDVRMKDGGRIFEFPSGARIQFGYIQHEADKYKFQSAEYQFVGFDELTQFPENVYTYLFSRVRRPQVSCLNCQTAVRRGPDNKWYHSNRGQKCPGGIFPDPKVIEQYPPAVGSGISVFNVPLRMRSATNPGGVGHDWVRRRFVDKKTRETSSIFIPASLRDNPSLDQESYIENLQHLSPADRMRLLEGDWDVFEAGDVFDPAWFKIVQDTSNVTGDTVRFWDRAATANGGDYTVGVLMTMTKDGSYYIKDVVRGQWSSRENERIIASTAARDGVNVQIRMEQEPGSSGKDVIDHYTRNILRGYAFRPVRPTGDKVVRASPFASACEAGNVFVQAAQWTKSYVDEFALFPIGKNDDQVDATSGAFSYLTLGRRTRVLV